MTQETHRRFLILPLIVIIGCLGSFPIAEYFLVPGQLQTTKTVTITYTDGACTSSVLASTSASATPTVTTTPTTSSTPDATKTPTTSSTPGATKTPSVSSTSGATKTPTTSSTPGATKTPAVSSTPNASASKQVPASLTTVWAETGSTDKDYTNAQACATAFVNTYETFDYQHLDSTTAALSLLSADAKKRFSEGYEKISPNPRTTEAWKQQIVTNQVVQTAHASTPNLEGYIYQKNELFLNFDVQYQLTTYTKGIKSVNNSSMTVRLKKIKPASSTSGIGWQVSDWRDDGATQ